MITSGFQPAIAATGLRKSFGGKVVLDDIDLHVAEGSIFSLLGPNGAGKTTMVQILSTLIGADGGQVRIAGHDLARDPASVRAAIGVTGQFSAVAGPLTGEENLHLTADLHHLERAEGRQRAAGLLSALRAERASTYRSLVRARALAMTPASSCARARDTRTCSALTGYSGCPSGQRPSTSPAALQPVRRSAASSASRPRIRGPAISWPR
jgi:ABC-2 type transport system ATP-binding protein